MAISKEEVMQSKYISEKLFKASVQLFDVWIEDGLRKKKFVDGRIGIDLPFIPSPNVWKEVKKIYTEAGWGIMLEINGEENDNAWAWVELS